MGENRKTMNTLLSKLWHFFLFLQTPFHRFFSHFFTVVKTALLFELLQFLITFEKRPSNTNSTEKFTLKRKARHSHTLSLDYL